MAAAAAKVAAKAGPTTVIDGDMVKANFKALSEAMPDVMPLMDGLCGQLASFMSEKLDGFGWFVAFNKPEVESALSSGVEPARLAFLAGAKPASAIKLGLRNGVKVFGCGSVNEMAKLAKAKGQGVALDIVIVLDPTDLQPLAVLLQMVDMARAQGDRVVGVSLQTIEDHVTDDQFTKAVAISRLVFEAVGGGCAGRLVFDMGQVDEKSEDRAAAAAAQLSAVGVKLAARAGATVTRDAVGLAVKVTAVKGSAAVVEESIYGAFSDLLAGGKKATDPHLVASPAAAASPPAASITYDIYGCTGEESDLIMTGARVGGLGDGPLRPGDWLVFPNVMSPAPTAVHLSSATPPSPWMTLEDDHSDISELEALFSLPDLTEEALESMFNV